MNELIVIEEAIETATGEQLVRHPGIEENQHGTDEHEWMEGVAAAVEGNDHAADDDKRREHDE